MRKARERYGSVAKVPCMHEKSRRLLEVWRATPMNAIGYKTFSEWKTDVTAYEPSYAALLRMRGFDVPGKLCSITQALHIMEDGSARPCPYIPYAIGNARRESLKSIWEKMKRDGFLQRLRTQVTSRAGVEGVSIEMFVEGVERGRTGYTETTLLKTLYA
jgi:hypothetical protein